MKVPKQWLLFVLVIVAVGSSQAMAQVPIGAPVCSTVLGPGIFTKYRTLNIFDKTKHCGASCELTRFCGPVESMELGIAKELYDLAGFGNPEWADLRADMVGIRLALSRSVRRNSDCLDRCSLIYPPHNP